MKRIVQYQANTFVAAVTAAVAVPFVAATMDVPNRLSVVSSAQQQFSTTQVLLPEAPPQNGSAGAGRPSGRRRIVQYQANVVPLTQLFVVAEQPLVESAFDFAVGLKAKPAPFAVGVLVPEKQYQAWIALPDNLPQARQQQVEIAAPLRSFDVAVTTVVEAAFDIVLNEGAPSLLELGGLVVPTQQEEAIPQGWERFFDRASIKPLAETQQSWSSFDPQGAIVSYTPQGWQRYSFQSVVRLSPIGISLQQGTPATPFKVPQAWGFAAEPITIRRPAPELAAVWRVEVQQQQDVLGPSFFDQVTKLLPVEQRWHSFDPQGDVTSTTPQGWERFFDKALIKPWPEAQQRYDAFIPAGQLVSYTPQGWERFFDKIVIRPLAAAQQAYAAWQPLGQVPTAATPQGWERFFDWTVIKSVPATQQQWAFFAPSGTIEVEVTRPAYSFFDAVTIRALQANLQPFVSFQPQGQVTSTTPQGWERFFDSARGRLPVKLGEEYLLYEPVVVAAPSGWSSELAVSLFKVGLTAPELMLGYFTPERVWGWPQVFDWAKGVALQQQQWAVSALFPVVQPLSPLVKSSFGVIVQETELEQGLGPAVSSVAEAAGAEWGFAEAQDPPLPVKRLLPEPSLLPAQRFVEEANFGWAEAKDAPLLVRHAPVEFIPAPTREFVLVRPVQSFFDADTIRALQARVRPPLGETLSVPQQFVVQAVFGFAEAYSQPLFRLVKPPEELAPLVTRVSAAEAEGFSGWNSELSTALLRRFGPPVEITGSLLRFVKLRGFLVCADLTITPAVDGSFVLMPAVDGSFTMTPELQAALALDPAVVAGFDLSAEVLAELDIDPAVLATPNVKEC